MTQMDELIDQNGVSLDIYRESEGALDAYRDPVPTWAKQASEKVWLQSARSIRLRGPQFVRGVAGVAEDFDFIGLFKSDSIVAKGDYITDGSTKYSVETLETATLLGATSHIEGYLKLITED